MSGSQTDTHQDLRARLRGQLGADAVLADYIHEVSDRHPHEAEADGPPTGPNAADFTA